MKTIITSIFALTAAVFALIAVVEHNAVQAPQTVKVGAAGAIDSVNYHCWAGVCQYYAATSLKTATTTPCAIQSPAATSTLEFVGVRLDVSSTTATTWDIARATTAFATTTTFGTAALAVAGNAQSYMTGTTTAPTAILPPNTWIVVGQRQGITAGDTAGTGFVPSGQCSAKFITSQS